MRSEHPRGALAEAELQRRIAEVESHLAALPGEPHWREAVEAHAAQLERLRERYAARFKAMEEVNQSISRLRQITSPATILGRAPRELCLCSQLDRAVVSLLRDGQLVAEAAWFHDDAVGAVKALETLGAAPPRLEHPLIETDVLRRRRATIVTDAQVHPRVHRPTARTMGWQTYLAAPLVVRGEVIGVIHGDAGASGRAVDVLDGDIMWAFSKGLAEVYETASLRRSLRLQRSETRRFVDWFGARSNELSDASMDLAPEQEEPPGPPGQVDALSAGSHADDRVAFEDLLTRRELEVLRLLVRGQTNLEVAAELVISHPTVKFHVTNILRKLRVSNRAAAVARYHRLVRGSAATRSAPPKPSGLP